MRIIEIAPLENGAHRNQSYPGFVPDGWALDRGDIETENFPFGEVTAEEIGGVMTMTRWTPLPMPKPDPAPDIDQNPTAQDDTDSMLIDHEYRLALLELGLV